VDLLLHFVRETSNVLETLVSTKWTSNTTNTTTGQPVTVSQLTAHGSEQVSFTGNS